jgi:hypothetical protein
MAQITVNELATTLESTPREVRKFLRSVTPLDEQPGKGGRWMIEKSKVRSIKSQFAKYVASKEAPEVPNDDEPEVDEANIEGTSD